ncbi:MAG: hypothetical protein LBJ36_10255 [Synergistaceae bacterium]|jgi:hypothetical protein|nr:hypothetical protein [Synergistaceae bacterium]
MEQNITERLVEFLRNKKVDFILLSGLTAPSPLRKALGLNSKSKPNEIEKNIGPYLGEKIEIRKKGKSLYLCLVQPLDETVLHALSIKGGESVGQFGKKVPIKKDMLHEPINVLVDKGLVQIKLSKTQLPCLYRVSAKAPRNTEEPKEEPKNEEQRAEQFHTAFWELERGEVFVDIYVLRRRLGWSRDVFDTILQKLRNAGTIQLHAGDTTTMTADEIADGFVDKNGFRMGTITWKK